MNTRKFIIKKIRELCQSFPEIKVSYSVDKFSRSNYLIVSPPSQYNSNNDYKEMEAKLIMEFIELYPDDEIGFFDENSKFEVPSPIFELEGKHYVNPLVTITSKTWEDDSFVNWTRITMNKSVQEVVKSYYTMSEALALINDWIKYIREQVNKTKK